MWLETRPDRWLRSSVGKTEFYRLRDTDKTELPPAPTRTYALAALSAGVAAASPALWDLPGGKADQSHHRLLLETFYHHQRTTSSFFSYAYHWPCPDLLEWKSLCHVVTITTRKSTGSGIPLTSTREGHERTLQKSLLCMGLNGSWLGHCCGSEIFF